MPDHAVTLRDAFSAYNTQVDLMMKFFTFLQVIAVATAGFMWSGSHGCTLRVPVFIGFMVFAIGNGRLVFQAYRDSEGVSKAIRQYRAAHPIQIPKELEPMFPAFENYPGWQLAVSHVFVDMVTLFAISRAPCA